MSTEDRLFDVLERDFRAIIYGTVVGLRTLCESEIEVMLGAAIAISFMLWPNSRSDFRVVLPEDEQKHKDFQFILMPQYPWQKYRIDWVFRARIGDKDEYIFVECDGHDFHERTKEQAEHDRSKDRSIQAAGIPILRFTGREIYRDAQQCAIQIFNFASKER